MKLPILAITPYGASSLSLISAIDGRVCRDVNLGSYFTIGSYLTSDIYEAARRSAACFICAYRRAIEWLRSAIAAAVRAQR